MKHMNRLQMFPSPERIFESMIYYHHALKVKYTTLSSLSLIQIRHIIYQLAFDLRLNAQKTSRYFQISN